MENLSRRIDPRFLRPLADALSHGPLTELEIRDLFLRDVPNRNLSLRSLHTLLHLAVKGGLLLREGNIWRLSGSSADQLIRDCLEVWAAPDFAADVLFRNRCSVCLAQGLLSAHAEFTPLPALAARASLSPAEWNRLISGLCDIRQLTGRDSKHVEADCLMVYRNAHAPPITDDADVLPRFDARLLPDLPAEAEALLEGAGRLRRSWEVQLGSVLGSVAVRDFSSFIIFAKDMLDLFFWGKRMPLRSTIAAEDLAALSARVQRYGLRAEDFSIAWRSLPFLYRQMARLSWGVRYLSNNLSHPQPPAPDAAAFLRVCDLPAATQSAISSARSGRSLLPLTRSLRVIHRAFAEWRGREVVLRACRECAAAVAADHFEDKLQRRAFAERIRRLQVVPPVYILDALAHELAPPSIAAAEDPALAAAAILSAYSGFIESSSGRAYAELRLALHSELDFKGRFNVHSLSPHQRYDGVWRDSLEQLVARVEDLRGAAAVQLAQASK